MFGFVFFVQWREDDEREKNSIEMEKGTELKGASEYGYGKQ